MDSNSTALNGSWVFEGKRLWKEDIYGWWPLIPGLMFNSLAVYAGRKAEVLGAYRYLINNVLLINISFCTIHLLSFSYQMVYYLLKLRTSLIECSIARVTEQLAFRFPIFAIPPLSIGRYIVLCFHSEFLSKKKALALILGFYALPICTCSVKVVGLFVVSTYKDTVHCGWVRHIYRHPLINALEERAFQISYIISLAFLIRVYLNLYRSFKQTHEVQQRLANPGHLRNEKRIFICIFVQTMTPLMLMFQRTVFRGKHRGIDPSLKLLLFNLNPLLDAIITLKFIAPYREGFLKLFNLNKNNTTADLPEQQLALQNRNHIARLKGEWAKNLETDNK